MVKRGEMMSVDDVQEILAVPLLGILPDDEQVVIATNQGEAIAGSGSKAEKPLRISATGSSGRVFPT